MAIQSFPPLARADAVVLILGSMPGRRSLEMQQYYAHPQNLFWPFMGELFGAGPELDYAARVEGLMEQGVAVWDVLRNCERQGSLDSAITAESMKTNDFAPFFEAHPRIRHIFFNGTTAESIFRRHVMPRLPASTLGMRRLPSTSPANASIPFAEKLACWQAVRIGIR